MINYQVYDTGMLQWMDDTLGNSSNVQNVSSECSQAAKNLLCASTFPRCTAEDSK